MNWEAIGAISEIVGALGVIITLLYVAVQIRHAAFTAKDGAFREVMVAVQSQLNAMIDDANRDIVLAGLMDYRALDARDKFKFDGLFIFFLAFAESSVIANDSNLMTSDIMEAWGGYMRPRFFAYPGMAQWWEGTRNAYIPEAQEWVEAQFGKADQSSDYWGIR